MTKIAEQLLSRLLHHKHLVDGVEAARFWDLRVNHVVGEWLREGRPDLDKIRLAGFGYIRHGSGTSGPVSMVD